MATDNKYDRQLRLWGAVGQKALSETVVVLIRATAAGTETVKNLVLPGVGRILVVDDVGTVNTEYSSNFFLVNDKGKTRAQMAMEKLRELNPDVEGAWKHLDGLADADWTSILSSQAEALAGRKPLVVASDLEPPLLEKVGSACDKLKVPLISVHSYGLIGIVRLQAPPLPLMNPKPRNAPPDLRLARPFDSLRELAESVQWDGLENHQHKNIPYPLILYRLAQDWKQRHEGKLPGSFAEKQAFQEEIKKASRNFADELNFQEAHSNAYLAYTAKTLDLDHLSAIREASEGTCPCLHQLLLALHLFLQEHPDQPPLQGVIPDMTASTDMYIKLQEAYRKQAENDMKKMRSLIPSPGVVSDDQLETFCQNLFAVDLLRTRTLQEEFSDIPDDNAEDLAMATMEGDERPELIPLLWYLGFRACQLFYQQHGRYPGVFLDQQPGGGSRDFEGEAKALQGFIVDVVRKYKLQENELVQSTLLKEDNLDYAKEMTRYGNAEVHNVASVIGGVASQEAVKVITGQYVPFDNTYIYNGIASIGAVYRF